MTKEAVLVNNRFHYICIQIRKRILHEKYAKQLALDKASAGISVRVADSLVRQGIEQRDASLRALCGVCTTGPAIIHFFSKT